MLKECVKIAYDRVVHHPEHWRHFSFVILRNEILSVGLNTKVDHATIYPRATLHSEYVAHRRAYRRLRKGWYMVNIRIGRDGTLRMSQPCAICRNILKTFGCAKVIYSNNEGGFSA